ncbi:hypothetical protein C4D60_Mb01t31020 [Musa balbisiana]|uniref:NmrA-like domain-containing protein n=1 Tax=Musa balbisiana TaxID=52838 RepID=A0A4S8JS10_MUSBA|nr:hypothetical protein C4D60_Mb01t31020 [Musa balbisiana]
MAGEKSKILIIGGTGYIGKFIVAASARSGHPIFALVRSTTAPADQPAKAKLLSDFQAAGVTLIQGDLYDHESLVKAIKQVDVGISTLGFMQLNDQTKVIDAIKDAGGHIMKKTGKTFERVYVPEEHVLKQIQEAPLPVNVMLAICHSAFVKGDHVFDIEPSFGVEASELYPDVKYTTVDEYLNRFL